jgi:hypothetical protein
MKQRDHPGGSVDESWKNWVDLMAETGAESTYASRREFP